MNDWLLQIIRCPISGESLGIAEDDLVSALRQRQQAGELLSHRGIVLDQPFDRGLVNQSKTYFYRVASEIPSLIPDEAVKLAP